MADLLTDTSKDPEGRAAFVCVRCAALGPTCCEIAPGQEECCFPVSELERQRISDHLVLTRGGFVEEKNSRAFAANLHRLFPRERRVVDALFPMGGTHLRLSTDARGRCQFLSGAGCVLPNEVRPYYCRLFPFWVVAGRLTVFTSGACLAHREGRTISGMLVSLETRAPSLLDLHRRLRLAWGLPPEEGMAFVTPALARFNT
ncbi:YkgJ family cysteine cluster protein [Desulfolutivibrio sulfoxidireducens]|uniref:YkgJ family cysteine cluster protein n=1 Tax=Desulfolutivibrio sulfoxidireducens TaxID=2773299 RepID=UPI001FE99858|nr:zinc/iron-chelating domain-containing protein [Desulfolutivibrio sulfoxidireducens]